MKTKISIAIAVIFVIGIVVIAVSNKGQGTPVTATSTASLGTKIYTLSDVSGHLNASSCWTTIDGKVYDVTTWIEKHPGGRDAILSLCGKDGSSAFNDQHGGQARPASELATFYIGDLKR